MITDWAILTDVTRCIGCEECVAACRRTHDTGVDAPYRWQGQPSQLSSTRWTTLAQLDDGGFARVQCRHCLDPSCAAACPVGALTKTPEGAVAYDATICMGCRYCMIACPFQVPKYEWDSPLPRVRKCVLCHELIMAGTLTQPACTGACPVEATVFGSRQELLAEARRRIAASPGRYVDHIWGEHEIGGTAVLTIAGARLEGAAWPASLDDQPRPWLARRVLHTVPMTFVGVAATMYGLQWTLDRRRKVAAAAAAEAAAQLERREES